MDSQGSSNTNTYSPGSIIGTLYFSLWQRHPFELDRYKTTRSGFMNKASQQIVSFAKCCWHGFRAKTQSWVQRNCDLYDELRRQGNQNNHCWRYWWNEEVEIKICIEANLLYWNSISLSCNFVLKYDIANVSINT